LIVVVIYSLTLCFKGGVCCGWKSIILVKIRGFAESRGSLQFAELRGGSRFEGKVVRVFVGRVKLRLMFWELAAADSGVEEVGAEVGMATTGEIRRAGLIVEVVGGFEVRV
jgi:hypothetical protein